MTNQAQTTMTTQDLNSIHAFCDELEAYLSTGIMPLQVNTYKGVQTFHVHNPVVYIHPCGDRKIGCKVVRAPEDFACMVGQHHSFSLLL